MYKTKMVKAYLPSIQICTFSLAVNFLVLGINPLRAIAQESVASKEEQHAANNQANPDLAGEILAEINRVRTNPQGYAHWLEEQRQYYDGSWIKLPGEKPIRTTSRGLTAIQEAIAFLEQLQPLPPLNTSTKIIDLATEKLDNFATANNIQYISYGRTTPKGIVMSLVIDELFPDRRRRNSLLSEEANNTGIVCKPDPRYAKVCAIAYSNSPVDSAPSPAETPTPTQDTEESSTVATVSQPKPPVDNSANETEALPEPPVDNSANATEALPEPPVDNSANATEALPEPPVDNSANETEALPEPPQAQLPPVAANTEVNSPAKEEVEKTEEAEEAEEETEAVEEVEVPEEVEETEAVEEKEETEVAVNSPPSDIEDSQILENVERGILEDGDRVIEEDGSFYDSYPLEAKAGDAFVIDLESDEFDAFVALIDSKGNIIDQNDDIDEENSNSRIRVTIPEDGKYNVIVNAYDQGGQGNYILTIRH